MKKKMLLLGLVLIGQGYAKSSRPTKAQEKDLRLLREEIEERYRNSQPVETAPVGIERILRENRIGANPLETIPAPQPPAIDEAPPMASPVTKIIVNKIMNNEQVPEWYAVSSLKELNEVRDQLFLKNAGANEFLRTPVKATQKEETHILSLLKAYKKRYKNNHEQYAKTVIHIMKYLPANQLYLRPLYFQMSGLQMSDLAEAGVNFTTYRLSIKDRALFKRTRRKILNGLTVDYDHLTSRLPVAY